MNWRHSPFAQVAQVLLRSINPKDARWLYVTVAFCVALTVLGGSFTAQWDVITLIRAVFGTIIFSLQFAGVYAFITLMRLNHPVISGLVPGYVPALRRSALAVWLCVCATTGLVALGSGSSIGESFSLSLGAGAVMLLISTPLRWPVRWCLFIVGLVWFLKYVVPYVLDLPPATFWLGLKTFAAIIFAVMGWLVTRLVAEKGSAYASLFSRFLGMQQSELMAEKPNSRDVLKFNLWFEIYARAAQVAKLPLQGYAEYLLARPQPGAANALARAELGLGAAVHWVTQVSFSLGFAVFVTLAWWMYPDLMQQTDAQILPFPVFLIAMVGVMCAVTSVLELFGVMLLKQGEQKLMLLLPGVPQGEGLSRALAARHLRLAFMAWSLAVLWALIVPYPDSVTNYVAAFCWGTLPLVPFVLQDWARAQAPQAGQAMLTLVLALLGPVCAWAALQWLHLQVELLAAIAASTCLLLLRMRWSRVAHYAQALPVGRLA